MIPFFLKKKLYIFKIHFSHFFGYKSNNEVFLFKICNIIDHWRLENLIFVVVFNFQECGRKVVS